MNVKFRNTEDPAKINSNLGDICLRTDSLFRCPSSFPTFNTDYYMFCGCANLNDSLPGFIVNAVTLFLHLCSSALPTFPAKIVVHYKHCFTILQYITMLLG